MRYDFTKIIDRHGKDAIAVDGLGKNPGFAPEPPKDGFDVIPMWVADMNFETVPTIPKAIMDRAAHPAYGYFSPVEEYYDSISTTCNSGIALEHKGEASPQLYAESCKQLGMVFKESEELIEKLGYTNISDVAGVVQEIRENYSIFPKGISEKVEAELRIQYPGGGTAIDVYLALNDIIQRYSEENKISPTRYLNLSEQVAKLMHLPFERIDQGEEWKKI